MGYDMSIRGTVPAAPEHDIEQARAAFDAASAALRKRIDAREFKNLEEQAEAHNESEKLWSKWHRLKSPDYFRLNIGGMSRYAGAMLDLGMVHNSKGPASFDGYPDYPEDEENETAMDAYQAAADKFTGWHGDSADPTIPLHKFDSNDGWHVTEDEIKAALDAWEHRANRSVTAQTSELIQTEYWGEWIAWLGLAAEHGGFRVH